MLGGGGHTLAPQPSFIIFALTTECMGPATSQSDWLPTLARWEVRKDHFLKAGNPRRWWRELKSQRHSSGLRPHFGAPHTERKISLDPRNFPSTPLLHR